MVTRVRREHERAQFDSGHPDLRPGVVTEACRSDTAAAVVRLHHGPLLRNREERGESSKENRKRATLIRQLPFSPRSPVYFLLSRVNSLESGKFSMTTQPLKRRPRIGTGVVV